MRLSKEVKVALLGIVAITALFFGYRFLKGTDFFTSTKKFYVIYPNVDGLTVSGPVMLNGIRVGVVQEMKLQVDNNNQIKVGITVQEGIPVGDSTIASLTSSDLLGGKAITLFMGKNNVQYKGGETLIPYVERSITTMLTEKAMPVLGQVDSTLVRLNSLLDADAKRNIQSIIANTSATTELLRTTMMANQRNVNAITANISALTTSLRETEEKFSRLASNLNEITDTLRNAPVAALIRNTNNTLQEAQAGITKLNETLSQSNGTVGRLMNDDSLYANMNASTESLNALLQDLKANPKRYVHFSLIGGGTKVKKADNVKTANKVRSATNVEQANNVEEVEKK
ncbi:mammalian cell entry protein [Adhaeribacter aerolatus]|uniref:Mammalian cell entry protein n=1 Tax=Adhaeribacter aerolatus TaxID=670289 RepID=A0A512B399_9BACT|nr:MlaD family protein [Adhaeribacter aerolatus]GEO06434.1 mammalian cell entry protein [Adhaeribacter aerolatus]